MPVANEDAMFRLENLAESLSNGFKREFKGFKASSRKIKLL